MTPTPPTLRVNLHFGSHTDETLRRELAARTPYARAKFIRQLALSAWRAQQAATRSGPAPATMPVSTSPPLETPALPAAANRDPPHTGAEQPFHEDVLSLLGQSVRL